MIGGSGFYTFLDGPREVEVDTPYGKPSAPIAIGTVGDHTVAFLPRHGKNHQFPAHQVNYRANMWALRALGVRRAFAPCAVGSLTPDLGPGAMVVPDQLVDRTSGRVATYFDAGGIHVGFADPYCPDLRAAATALPGVTDGGTMVVIEGPRFSTRAESQWYARQGFTLINMTGYPEAVLAAATSAFGDERDDILAMLPGAGPQVGAIAGYPEAVLARELEICYAAIALVTDLDAGIETGTGVTAVDVFAEFERNLPPFKKLVAEALDGVGSERACTHCLAHEGVTLPFELP